MSGLVACYHANSLTFMVCLDVANAEVRTGEEIRTWEAHANAVTCICYAVEDFYEATASRRLVHVRALVRCTGLAIVEWVIGLPLANQFMVTTIVIFRTAANFLGVIVRDCFCFCFRWCSCP